MKKIFVKIEYPQTTIKPSHLIKEELIELGTRVVEDWGGYDNIVEG